MYSARSVSFITRALSSAAVEAAGRLKAKK
jgi:hypothetical protein